MADLDDPELYGRLDPSRLRDRIFALPSQCEEAWRQALAFPLPSSHGQVERVVVLGMGGSAIGGDLLADLQAKEGGTPILVHRGYSLPALVDERTLAIASSFSGNTEETLAAFAQALKRGAKGLASTTGGRLATLSQSEGVPLFTIRHQGEPRSALGFGLLPLIAFLQNLGLASDKSRQVEEAVKEMGKLREELHRGVPEERNQAKQMARAAHDRIVVIHGAEHLSAAARRWKTQIAENGKGWAFFELLPELNHNSIEGVQFPSGLAERLFIVMLRASQYSPAVARRCDLTAELLREAGFAVEPVEAWGQGPLAQMMTAILLGDYVSYYLAMLNGVDPSPVPSIERFKSRLAAG